MPIIDLDSVPKEIWFIFIGSLLFGLLLPMLAAHGVIKIVTSLKSESLSKYHWEELNFYKRLILGWCVVVPVYIYSYCSL
ncbi:hypothetical protein TDB9533_03460 [Thalassocella blandensis]|nr:hypothetical protein TDB9533_03460 [Thalassocella blandensis]